MGTKKHIIKIIIFWMIVSIIIFTVLQFHIYPDCFRKCMIAIFQDKVRLIREYLIIIFSGIFTSTVTTLFITVREYQDEKVQTLTDYYYVSRDFLKHFFAIEYLKFNHPVELVIGCLYEEGENKRKRLENEDMKRIFYKDGKSKKSKKKYRQSCKKISSVEKSKLQQFIWDQLDEDTSIMLSKSDDKEHFLDVEYRKVMDGYYAEIDKVVNQYIKIAELNYRDVETAYAKIDFFFKNNKIRNHLIYEKIHNRQREMLRMIKQKSSHFKNNNNLPAMIKIITDIQDKIFIKEESEIGYNIYNTYFLEIENQLCELLKVVYGKHYEGENPNKEEGYVCSIIQPEKL